MDDKKLSSSIIRTLGDSIFLVYNGLPGPSNELFSYPNGTLAALAMAMLIYECIRICEDLHHSRHSDGIRVIRIA